MKLLVSALLASMAIASPATAKPIYNDWQRALMGQECADGVEEYTANMKVIYSNEAAYRPFHKVGDLKVASAPGLRARMKMEKHCDPSFLGSFDNRMMTRARETKNSWATQTLLWYTTQVSLVKQGLIKPYF